MLEIDNLKEVHHSDIVKCLLESFKNYFVPMPSSLEYWANRFKTARVDFSMSYGVSFEDNLLAFIIHGIDDHNGLKTAFNTGTGVIENYRGMALVDQLYQNAIPRLQEAGIQKCMLEVIQANLRAIKVYERIGFKITRTIKCYKGQLTPASTIEITPCKIEEVESTEDPSTYAWDHTKKAIQLSNDQYQSYKVFDSKKEIGYFTINPQSGYLARLEAYEGDYKSLCHGIGQINTEVRTNNIDEQLSQKCNALEKLGWVNSIDQYEMELSL